MSILYTILHEWKSKNVKGIVTKLLILTLSKQMQFNTPDILIDRGEMQ